MAQAIFTDINLFKNQLQNAVIHSGITLPTTSPADEKDKPKDGQLFNLTSKQEDKPAGLYVYKDNSNDWQHIPTSASIEQLIKDSVKGLKPKGSVNYTNWVNIPVEKVETDEEKDENNISIFNHPDLKIGNTDEYRTCYKIHFRPLNDTELGDVLSYLENRFNYSEDEDEEKRKTYIKSKYNIDLGEVGDPTDNFVFKNKTILLKNSLDNSEDSENGGKSKHHGAYKVWRETKQEEGRRTLYLHRVENFSDDIVDDGTTDGRLANNTEIDATNVYLFVQSGQQYVHRDVSFVQTRDAVLADSGVVEGGITKDNELFFQQFSGAQDGLSATGSLKITDGNTVEAVTTKAFANDDTKVLVTFDTVSKLEDTAKVVAEKTRIRTVTTDKIETMDDGQEKTVKAQLENLETEINSAILSDINAKDTDGSFAANAENPPSPPALSNYEIVSVEVFHNTEKVMVGVDIQKDEAKVKITYNTNNSLLKTLEVTAEIRYRLSGNIYSLLAHNKKAGAWQE